MRVVEYSRYGPPEVLHLVQREEPVLGQRDVLVQVCATTVTAGDVRMRSFNVPRGEWLFARLYLGLSGPRRRVLGMELAGVVTAVGQGVTRFRVGDRVMASTFSTGFGGYAEFKCLPEDGMLALTPVGLNLEEAATLPVGAATALRFLRQGALRRGQAVLVYGASGSVGTFAVQLARHLGATVTGVCSGGNLELVRSLGAQRVLDYRQGDWEAGAGKYDLVFDAVGKASKADLLRLVAAGGRCVSVLGSAKERRQDLDELREIAAADGLKPVIERIYPMEEIVQAHRHVETGHNKGNVVVRVSNVAGEE